MEICDLMVSLILFPLYKLGLILPLTPKDVMKIN